MEKSPLKQWIYPLKNDVSFHSYVKLADGKSRQIPLNLQVPMVFQRFYHGFLMVLWGKCG